MGQQDYADKARKLMTKADDPATPAEERESLLEAVERLLAKDLVTEAELQHRDPTRTAKIMKLVMQCEPDLPAIMSLALSEMAGSIGAPLGVHGFTRRIHRNVSFRHEATVIGFEDDVARVEYLWRSIQRQAMRAANEALREALQDDYWRPWTRQEKDVFRQSFIRAYGDRVGMRLWKMRWEAEGEASTGTDLVLADRYAQVNTWIEDNFKYRKAKPRVTDALGKDAGWHAGANATIAQGDVSGSGIKAVSR